MALEEKIQEVPFADSLDESTADQLRDTPKLTQAVNAMRDKKGLIQKRSGHFATRTQVVRPEPRKYNSGTPIFSPFDPIEAPHRGVLVREDEAVLFDQSRCLSYMESEDKFVHRSMATSVQCRSEQVTDSTVEQVRVQVRESNGLRCTVWVSLDDHEGTREERVMYSVVEISTGAYLANDVLIESTTFVRCLRLTVGGVPGNTSFQVLWSNTQVVRRCSIEATNIQSAPLNSVPFDFISDVHEIYTYFDAVDYDVAGTRKVTVVYNNAGGTLTSRIDNGASVNFGTVSENGIGIYRDGDSLHVITARDSGGGSIVHYHHLDLAGVTQWNTLLETPPRTVLQVSIGPGMGPTYRVGCLYSIEGPPHTAAGVTAAKGFMTEMHSRFIDPAAKLVAANVQPVGNAHIITKPVERAGCLFVVISNDTGYVADTTAGPDSTYEERESINGVYGLMRLEQIDDPEYGSNDYYNRANVFYRWEICGNWRPGTAGGFRAHQSVAEVTVEANDVWIWGGSIRTIFRSDVLERVQGAKAAASFWLDFADTDAAYNTVEANRVSLVSGGMDQQYDGQTLTESSFLWAPIPSDVRAQEYDEGSVGSGANAWIAVYEWTDELGQVHQSAPSKLVGRNFEPELGPVRFLGYSWSPKDTRLALYKRREDGIFHRARIRDADVTGLYYVYPGFPAGAAAFPQTRPFRVYERNYLTNAPEYNGLRAQTLYTTGGVLENDPAPSHRHLRMFKNRVWIVSSENKNELWFSKNITEDSAVNFSAFLRFLVGTPREPIIGVEVMDSWLIVFKRDSIYAVGGEPPNDLGAGSTLRFRRIPGDTGCVTSKSIVLLPGGIIFQSARGLYLLNRGLQISFIGDPVEDTVGTFPVVATAVYPEDQLARFYLGRDAVDFNYAYGQWFKQELSFQVAAAAAWRDGGFLATADRDEAVVGRPGLFTDPFTSVGTDPIEIPMTVQTPWVRREVVEGWQRLWKALLLMHYRSAQNLNVSIEYDFVEGVVENKRWLSGDIELARQVDGADTERVQVEIRLKRQTFESVRFTFYVSHPTEISSPPFEDPIFGHSVRDGLALSVLRLHWGATSESMRLPTAAATRK